MTIRVDIFFFVNFEEIFEDYVHPKLKFDSGSPIQLDLYLPKISLALEYQGEQHYFDVFRYAPHKHYEYRDIQKRSQCMDIGLTLIEVPYWWDCKLESLRVTIHSHRPDLITTPGEGKGIPLHPQPKLKNSEKIKN